MATGGAVWTGALEAEMEEGAFFRVETLRDGYFRLDATFALDGRGETTRADAGNGTVNAGSNTLAPVLA